MTKGKNLQEIWDTLPEVRKQRIEARARELEAEYLTLQQIRKTAGVTQADVSEKLGMPQPNVSRLERGSDLLVSTLRQYVEAVGGTLTLTVKLPHHPPVNIQVPSDLVDQPLMM